MKSLISEKKILVVVIGVSPSENSGGLSLGNKMKKGSAYRYLNEHLQERDLSHLLADDLSNAEEVAHKASFFSRRCALLRALRAMQSAGETVEAGKTFLSILGPIRS